MGSRRRRTRARSRRCDGAPDDGSEVDAAWVVGADGAHSVVRKAMGIGFPGVPIVERFLLADVHADIDRPREGAVSWLRGDMALAAFPLPGDDLWRVMAPAPTEFGDEPAPEAIVDYLGSRLAAEAAGTIHSTVWTSTFRIHRRLADGYRRGRVLLAGDAAHIHSPLGGQGMNTGIGDAENLAWKLALVVSGRADHSLLDTYEAERRPIAKGVLETTSSVTEMVVSQRWAARLLRDRVAVPDEPRMGTATDHGKGVPAEGFVPTRPARRATLAVPSRSTRRRPRRRSNMHSRRRDDSAALRRVGARLGADRVRLTGRGGARRLGDVVVLRGDGEGLLVRPDGHLAWRGTDAARLQAWLDNALGPRIEVLTP